MGRLFNWIMALAAVAALVGALAAPLAGASPGKGEVGGPPTFSVPPVPPGEGVRTTPALVIGEGTALGRSFEIVAHGYTPPAASGSPFDHQVCVWVVYSRHERSFGTCETVLAPAFEAGPIRIDSFTQLIAPKPLRDTELSGLVAPEVASVALAFRRRDEGPVFRPGATVAQVSGDLQRELRQPAPFGYFVAKIRGLVPMRRLRAFAYDSADRPIGSARGLAGRRLY